eukprot:scaffold982_cov139-Cylindrotheca_fusiformis.AAC.7
MVRHVPPTEAVEKGDVSSTSVDMAGRVCHHWSEKETGHDFLCGSIDYSSAVLYDPSELKNNASESDSESLPFDEQREPSSSPKVAPQTPLRFPNISEFLGTSPVWKQVEKLRKLSGGQASQNPVSASSRNDSMAADVTSEANQSDSSFHRRLNHRRRLKRIHYLQEHVEERPRRTVLHPTIVLPQSPSNPLDQTPPPALPRNEDTDNDGEPAQAPMNVLECITPTGSPRRSESSTSKEVVSPTMNRLREDTKSEAASVLSEYTKTDESTLEGIFPDCSCWGAGTATMKSQLGRRRRSDRNLEIGVIKQGASAAFVKQQKLQVQSPKRQAKMDDPFGSARRVLDAGMTGFVSTLGIFASRGEEVDEDADAGSIEYQSSVTPNGIEEEKKEDFAQIDLEGWIAESTSGENSDSKFDISVQSPASTIIEKSEAVGGEEQNEMTDVLDGIPFHNPGITHGDGAEQKVVSDDSESIPFQEIEPISGAAAQNEMPEILEGFPFPLSSLDTDPDFAVLALLAARSIHQLRGMTFDESYMIDMYSDLKVCVVELKLPLGCKEQSQMFAIAFYLSLTLLLIVVLMENEGGCFIFKIAPGGSAARSGGVEVGDQLGAINGQKSLKMKVDDIYNSIPASSDPALVQLAFIRYTGPTHSDGPYVGVSDNEHVKTSPRSSSRVSKDKPTQTIVEKKRRNWFGRRKG